MDSDSRQLLYNDAMDEAPIGITISDPAQPDNPLVYINDGFCELTGYLRDEVLGQNCRFLQGEATRGEPVAQMREAIEAEEPVSVELRNYRKDGSMFWNRVTIIPIRSDSGTVTKYLGYQQDITAQKRYEQDLSVFKRQAEQSEKAIVITDSDGTIQYVNPAFERVNGYTADEAIGRNPRILKSGQHSEEFYAELWETITAGDVWEAELVNKTKYGELYEGKHTIAPVTNLDGDITHFVGIAEDRTEDVLTTQTLGILNRVMRHNLRNALNVIDGHAELLEDEELDSEARQASVEAIRDRAALMRNVAEKTAEIRSIWSQAEDSERWEQLDLESVLQTYQRQYPDAEITCRLADTEAIQVRNAELFKKALEEAVTNAIEHTDRSPPDVTITFHRDPDDDQFRLSVADNGPGISAIERQAIKSGEETPLEHGLGIGLWVMKWVTTTLGGELTITDNEPRGSVVTFYLPTGDSKAK
nr:PAS domain-containing protein [Natranaeroarchaeum aerophilus]